MMDDVSQLEKDEYWMMQALRLAQSARDQNEVPVGAILVKNEVQIAQAWNQSITLNDPTAHAEILCLRAGGDKTENYRLNDTTLYVTLEPCAMCVGAMVHARISRLVYAASEPKAGCVHSHGLMNETFLNHKITVTSGVLEEQSAKLLSGFFAQRREIKKREKEEVVASPCVSVCALDSDDVCIGCYRNTNEIRDWTTYNNQQKKQVIKQAQLRMNSMWSL